MKWILSIFLIILLSCVNTLEKENSRVDVKTLKKMIDHMTRIRNLFRNLEEGDTGSDENPTSDDSESEPSESEPSESEPSESNPNTPGNTTETVPTALNTAPITRGNRRARIQVIALNNYKVDNSLITFVLYLLFTSENPANEVSLVLTILYAGRLRHLQEVNNETAICKSVASTQTQGNIRYNCQAPKKAGVDIKQIVVNPDVTLNGNRLVRGDLGEINFSEEAALAALNLQDQTQELGKMYYLNNGKLTSYPKYFIIKGDIEEYNGKVGDELRLVVYDNTTEPSTPQDVVCKVNKANNKNYEFKCTPTQSGKGVIFRSPMYFGENNAITLNMDPDSEYVSYTVAGPTSQNNPIYRKSSSGLSGGAIAGIVIACAVVLIIASIIAMMLRKPAVPAINNTSSVVGLRTVDNYTE